MEAILSTFITASGTPYCSWPERYPGRQATGYICNYAPEEIIIHRIVAERTGVAGLVIEADMCDSRAYTEGPIKTRIQAFMETLAR